MPLTNIAVHPLETDNETEIRERPKVRRRTSNMQNGAANSTLPLSDFTPSRDRSDVSTRPPSAQRRLPLMENGRRVFATDLVKKRQESIARFMPSVKSKFDDAKRYTKGWAGWKQRRRIGWMRFKRRMREIGAWFELWRSSFKTIEGHFGSGVVSYFTFLKWLFMLNFLIFLLLFLFVTIPQLVFPPTNYDKYVLGTTTNTVFQRNHSAEILLDTPTITNATVNQSLICSALYQVNVSRTDVLQLVLDFLQGTGWMEKTVLFYGYYDDRRLEILATNGFVYSYNMPLAYLLVTVAYFGLSLILMVRHTGKSLKNQMVESKDTYYQYCNKVFGSWDFSIMSPANVELKHKSMYYEISGDLNEERNAKRRKARTCCKKCGIWTVRFLVNLFVLAILGGAGYLIYYTMEESTKFKERSDYESINQFLKLLMEFLPSLTITFLNAIIPFLFIKIVKLEDYTPAFEIKITLWRTVFLKLASLAVLIGTLYGQVVCSPKEALCNTGQPPTCAPLQCWETYVGQQIYKLVILDFITAFITTFFVEFPRNLIVTRCGCKLSNLIGRQEFDIPHNVLGLVYSQTLCWIGAFFSPLIPAICFFKTFLLFYMKKLTCIFNCIPSERPYRASKTNSFFMVILIVAFVLCCVPVGYVIWRLSPSKGCGPFRIYTYMFDILSITIASWPLVIRQIVEFLTSAGFIVPAIVVLCVAIYYYHALADANKEMTKLLKEQLTLEGRDKQFLLTRINELTGQAVPGRDKLYGKHTHGQPATPSTVNTDLP